MAINLPIVSKFSDAGVKAAESSLKKFSQFAKQSAVAATAAIAGIATVSIREFGNFDSALQQSVSIMGDVSDALRNDMAEAAREVAKTTTFSAEQAAESFYFLASAGLDATASITAMPKVAQFAQAGMFDMARATDLLTDAQSALGLTIRDDAIANMEEMVRVSDVLVRANTLANASVEQFSVALTTKSGAALRSLNKDMEEGVAVLAAFADQGIKGELAGTQLSIVLRDLTTKAIKNKAEFEAMGLQVFDTEGNMRNLGDIIANLEDVLVGMSDETQKATLLQAGFSDKSLASIQALLGTSDAIKRYETELRAASGTTDDIANKQLESFNAQMDLLKSRLLDVAIEIGGQLAPRLLDLLDRLSPIIDEAAPMLLRLFDNINAIFKENYDRLSPLVEDALPKFQTLFEDLRKPIGQVLEFLRILGETVLNTVIKLVTNASFLAALSSIGKSFGIIAEQIGIVLKSPIVQFLLDLTSGIIITGLNVLAAALEAVANVFQRVIDVIKAFNRTSVAPKTLPGGGMTSVSGFEINRGTQTYVPGFAEGGIVLPTPGGTLAIIGEAGQSEAVIPLDRLDAMMGRGGGNISITVNAGMGTDGQDVGRKIVDEIIRYERASGRVFARA
jgi:TP901 family phage tail tape measure protein